MLRLYHCSPTCSYEVRKKKKGCVDEIAELIVEKFTRKISPHNKRTWTVQVRVKCGKAKAEVLCRRGKASL